MASKQFSENANGDNSSVNSEKAETSGTVSWASVTSRFSNKNVLEVILDKDYRGSYVVSENECAKFLNKLGLDLRLGAQVEGVQICPNGRGVMYITLGQQVDPTKFCRYDVVDITSSGIRSVLVKQAGKH